MNDRDLEQFEADLARLRPGEPDQEFIARLVAAAPPVSTTIVPDRRLGPSRHKSDLWRGIFSRIGAPWRLPGWFAATAAAALALALLAWLAFGPDTRLGTHGLGSSGGRALRADKVEIGQDLLATFDAVALLPSGQPVRFRCQQWSDQMLLRDSRKGVVIEERTPRLEIVPVRFETY